MKLSKHLKIFINNFIFFLIFLLIIECILTVFFPLYMVGNNDDYQYDHDIGYVAKTGHRYKTTDYQMEMVVNDLGTLNFQKNFEGYQNIIFVVGDSYTQGVGVPSDASFPFFLDLALNINESGYYQKKYAVINLGLSGRGGKQNLLILKRYIEKLGKPNIIVYLGCENDYDDDIWFDAGNVHKSIIDKSEYWGILYYPAKLLLVESEIGKRLKILINKTRRNNQIFSNHSSKTSVAEKEKNILDQLKLISDQNSAKLVISWANDTDSYSYLEKWSLDNNVKFVNWLDPAKSVVKNMPELTLENNHSGGHYRVFVNKVMAHQFSKKIK